MLNTYYHFSKKLKYFAFWQQMKARQRSPLSFDEKNLGDYCLGIRDDVSNDDVI